MAESVEVGESALDELRELIGWMDEHLDRDVAEQYKGQPLAQDWARVAKVTEEAGEAIDALIGITGQNPRKGTYGSRQDLYDELCDVALTALYGLQHFTKNRYETIGQLFDRARYHRKRVEDALADAALSDEAKREIRRGLVGYYDECCDNGTMGERHDCQKKSPRVASLVEQLEAAVNAAKAARL